MRIWIFYLSLALSLPALHAAIADDLPGVEDELAAEAARLRVGVAPFEAAGPSGAEVPDFATLLADLLGTRGVGRIVGPEQFGAPATAQVEASAVRAWAAAAAVDSGGTFRGDGFRYHIEERRFELLGNVVMEQTP